MHKSKYAQTEEDIRQMLKYCVKPDISREEQNNSCDFFSFLILKVMCYKILYFLPQKN